MSHDKSVHAPAVSFQHAVSLPLPRTLGRCSMRSIKPGLHQAVAHTE